MIRRYAILLVTIATISLFLPISSADTEPNDSIYEAEYLTEGSMMGAVTGGDDDYYRIIVPNKKDLVIDFTKTDDEYGQMDCVSMSSADSESGVIFCRVRMQRDSATDRWYNNEGEDTQLYLKVEGDGTYRLSIKITSDTQDALDATDSFCFLSTFCLFIMGVAFILFVGLIFFVRFKMKSRR